MFFFLFSLSNNILLCIFIPLFKLQLQLLANVIIKNSPPFSRMCVCVKLAIILTSSVHMYLYELCIICCCCCFGTSDGVNGIFLRRRLGVVVVVVVRVMMVIMLLLMVMTHMLLLCYSWLLLCGAVAVVVVVLILVRVVLVVHQTLEKGKKRERKSVNNFNICCGL